MIVQTTQAHLVLENIKTELGFAEIKLDEVKLTKTFNTILHVFNPNEISKILDNIEINIKEAELQEKALPLQQQIQTIRNKIQTLIPHRQRRGLFNFVGTMHKWLFGTMDDTDKQDIEEHLKTIDLNNHNSVNYLNKQLKINQHFNKTLMNLGELINKDRLVIRKN